MYNVFFTIFKNCTQQVHQCWFQFEAGVILYKSKHDLVEPGDPSFSHATLPTPQSHQGYTHSLNKAI